MHVTLRYLAGGSVHDIHVLTGISHSSFYRFLWCGIDAINGCDALQLKWSHTMEELRDAAKGFHWSSSHGVINSCVGALDGWLCRIRVPAKTEVTKVKSFFSGHYQCCGLNIQATCDVNCKFTPISCMCPGGSSDSKSFYHSTTYNLVQNLPNGYFVVGDNAYTLSSTLIVPYSGRNRLDPSKDACNFYIYQLRI
jgi:hypothetical protein